MQVTTPGEPPATTAALMPLPRAEVCEIMIPGAPMPRFLVLALFAVPLVAQSSLPPEHALLKPKALAGQPGAATAAELRLHFADPPAAYRSMPLWVWNDLMEWPRIQEQLAQFKRQGIGGVFIHPRPGLMTEYLGTDWLRLWKQSMEEGKRLGLLVNIYDENSYPSGFAGGHVPARAPDTASQFVQVEFDVPVRSVTPRANPSDVAFFALRKDERGRVIEARHAVKPDDVPSGWAVAAFRLRRASGNPWTAQFPYVDLTNPQTTPTFLDTTYEVYKKLIGEEFGKTVRWAFSDEPLLATGGAYDAARLALPLSHNTLAEFQKRNGYDLAGEIASLYWDVGDYRKVRFDYWQTMHDLWKENFMRPMFEWCDRNNLQFTGHWMEHEWPQPWITPADANLYAFEHMPGIDMLEGTNLRLKGNDPHMLFTIKQVASVSHQLGRRAFCEAYGVAGWDSTFEHYKRFGDWLMVHGINFMDQHLAFTTIRGARKRDHPQSFTDVSPWWPYYRLHADHLARVSYVSSRSESRNRVLVLEQTTSGFLLAHRDGAPSELLAMRAANAEMNQFLADRLVDYDLGDEYMIEWFGGQDGRKFRIGKASYDVLVWPPDMTNVRHQTIAHLESYLAAGGEILALSAPAAYVDGRPNDAVVRLASRYAAQWKQAGGLSDLVAAIRQRTKPRVELDHDLANVGFFEHWLPGGDRALFFANSGTDPVRARATVEAGSIEVWDTVTGRTASAAYTVASDGRVAFDLDLAPAGSLMLLARKAEGKPATASEPAFTAATAGEWKVKADAPNVLPLDYCDLTMGKEALRDINTWQANWIVWQRHGFERPAWDNAVQFKTRVFDRNHFGKESGFAARFRFDVADAAALQGLRLAVESPELYRITVNGKPVDFKAAARWKDPHIRAVSIAGLAQPGENFVEIAGRPFDVKMELENIFLLGRFGVEAGGKGFRLSAVRSAGLGSWRAQGYPFYGESMTYETTVVAPAGTKQMRVELPEWSGSVAEVLLDGKRAGLIAWQPFRAEFAAAPGRHALAVKVVATPRNTFGPFHNPSKPRMRAWPAAWADFPEHQPAGSAYDVLDYGLMAPPAVAVRR